MTNSLFVPISELTEPVFDGAKLAVPKDSCGVAMQATRELVRGGVRDLHLVCVPTGGIQAEILHFLDGRVEAFFAGAGNQQLIPLRAQPAGGLKTNAAGGTCDDGGLAGHWSRSPWN